MQLRYNQEHGITPQAIVKARNSIIGVDSNMSANDETRQHARRYESNVQDMSSLQRQVEAEFDHSAGVAADPVIAYMKPQDLEKTIEYLKAQMVAAAKNMEFLAAAQYRDEILKLQERVDAKQ